MWSGNHTSQWRPKQAWANSRIIKDSAPSSVPVTLLIQALATLQVLRTQQYAQSQEAWLDELSGI